MGILFFIKTFSDQGTLPLPGLQLTCVCQERGDDPALQVAQEARRVPTARLHAVLTQ